MIKGYPIKYSILPLNPTKGSRNYGLKCKEDEIEGYIVSKCYVISCTVNYYYKDEPNLMYEIIFPYEKYGSFKENEKKYLEASNTGMPMGDDYIGRTTLVTRLYDTYEEAQEAAAIANDHLLDMKLAKHSPTTTTSQYREQCKEIIQKFKNDLKTCKKYEELITSLTKNMNVKRYYGFIDKPTEVIYTVKPGDSLYTIAKEHGLTVGEIMELNPLPNNKLESGKVLRLTPPLQK